MQLFNFNKMLLQPSPCYSNCNFCSKIFVANVRTYFHRLAKHNKEGHVATRCFNIVTVQECYVVLHFAVKKAAALKNGVEICQKSIGAIRCGLTRLYNNVWHRTPLQKSFWWVIVWC